MTEEFELRAKVKNLKGIKKTLREMGLKSSGEFLVKDYAFDKKENYFYKKGVMIRARSIGNQKHLFAYKGPCGDSFYKVRGEIEIEVSDPNKLAKILKNIGLNVTFEMEKVRETYYIDGGKIELDHYPFLGCFVEIEAPPENIEKIIKKLNISRERFNNRSLDYYIDNKRKELGFDFEIKFDAEKEFLSKKGGGHDIEDNLTRKRVVEINLESYNAISENFYEETKPIILLDIINKFLLLIGKDEKVLDLGCGPGRDMAFFEKRGIECFGIDISPQMIKVAKEKNHLKNVFVGNMYNIPFGDNFFENIYCSASLSHIPKKELHSVLSEVKRVGKKNGVFFCSVKLGDGEHIVEEDKYGRKIKRFWAFYNPEEIKNKLRKSGFKIIECQMTGSLTKKKSGKGWINVFSRLPN